MGPGLGLGLKFRNSGGAAPDPGTGLIINGNFDSDTVWVKGSGWVITGGQATRGAGATSDLIQSIALPIGTYRVMLDIASISGAGLQTRISGSGNTYTGTVQTTPGMKQLDIAILTDETTFTLRAALNAVVAIESVSMTKIA